MRMPNGDRKAVIETDSINHLSAGSKHDVERMVEVIKQQAEARAPPDGFTKEQCQRQFVVNHDDLFDPRPGGGFKPKVFFNWVPLEQVD